MDNKPDLKELEENKVALRAFVCPELYPFILDEYRNSGKLEETLKADIKLAREKYKEIVDALKPSNVKSLGENNVNKSKSKVRDQYWSGKNKKSNPKRNSGGNGRVGPTVEKIVPENDNGNEKRISVS